MKSGTLQYAGLVARVEKINGYRILVGRFGRK
jgi:hypothetical protein